MQCPVLNNVVEIEDTRTTNEVKCGILKDLTALTERLARMKNERRISDSMHSQLRSGVDLATIQFLDRGTVRYAKKAEEIVRKYNLALDRVTH
jgi:hypothetical protein